MGVLERFIWACLDQILAQPAIFGPTMVQPTIVGPKSASTKAISVCVCWLVLVVLFVWGSGCPFLPQSEEVY